MNCTHSSSKTSLIRLMTVGIMAHTLLHVVAMLPALVGLVDVGLHFHNHGEWDFTGLSSGLLWSIFLNVATHVMLALAVVYTEKIRIQIN